METASCWDFARANGATALGVEIQADLRARAESAGFRVFAAIGDIVRAVPAGSVDLVAAFDVLEHLAVEEMVTVLTAARTMVAETTGVLIVRFPNGDNPFSAVHQRGDHTHKSVIGAGMIQEILRSAGWRIAYLGAESAAPGSLAKRAQYVVRDSARWFVERSVAFLYYGGGAPPTLASNYLVCSRPG